MTSMRRRVLPAVLAFALLTGSMLAEEGVPAHAQASDADLIKLACSIPHQWLLETWRGWRPDRGAQLSYIPLEPNFVGSGLPHVGPWPYVEDVPMLWLGPGIIPAGKVVNRPVTLANVAPTSAKLLHFDGFHPIDGRSMPEVLQTGAPTPKLLVTLVWDAGGMNVLNAWPNAHPYLDSLLRQGTWFSNASVGSSPTSTAQDHAIIGTGDFPDHNGIVGHHLTIGGKLTSPWNDGPSFLIEPTLADIYDRAMGNKPVVGIVGTVDIHFGMLGHGAFFTGGDRDIALTRSVVGGDTLTSEGFTWNLPVRDAPYYKLAGYANKVPGFAADVRKVDEADGKLDGMWRNNSIDQLLKGFDTPARTPYEERVVETVIKKEGFGKDTMPDLLFINFKEIDYVSHVWSMNSLEMRDAVVAQDQALKRFVYFLNQQIGKGNWAMVLTADHGAMPDPAVSGGYQISTAPIEAGINAKFDTNGDKTPIVNLVQPSQVFLNTDELAKNGYTVADVARYIMTLTQAQTAGPGQTVNPATANDKVFQAAFPSALMQQLPCLPEARQ